MERVIGIDLGTTNSCVAVKDAEGVRVIPNRGGYKTTPSMVAVTQSGKRLVGHIAKRQAITNAENTVYAAKRLIGRPWDSPQVAAARETSSFHLVEGPHNDARIQLRDGVYSLPELSSMILQEMKIIADDHLAQPVTKAVVTVPAHFNDNQRQATKDAGAIAGLDIIRIINEPTAAALAFGFGKRINETVVVYDLGGGTFDVSILDISQGGVFKVIATTGDTFLGGEDFDAEVIDWLVASFMEEHGVDLRQDRMALQRLKDAAEKAKCELSSLESVELNLPFIISAGRNEALHLQCTLTRDKLEALTASLVDRTIEICRQALEGAELDVEDIDDVLLVGGMTRMPAIQRATEKLFGRRPNQGVHPDEVVALGAAIQGAALLQSSEQLLLLDVTPHSLGIMTAGRHFEELIAQNTTVPTSSSKVFTTSRDNQTAVKILVMQRDDAEDHNELLGEFVLTGLRRAPRGEVEVEVTFKIDTDGIVSVSATDIETNLAQTIQVTASSGLTEDEVTGMIENAKGYLVERRADERFEEIKQTVERAAAELERLIPRIEQVVGRSEFGQDAVRRARETLERAGTALKTGDADAAKTELAVIERVQRLFRQVVAGA